MLEKLLKEAGKNIPRPFGIFLSGGLDSGIFVFSKVETNPQGSLNINNIGALMYLSKRTLHSQVAQLYLFDQESDYFKLAHTESSLFVDNLRQQNIDVGEFVYYQGLQGPIKIWEINYPSSAEVKEIYLQKEYPNLDVTIINEGEY